LGFDVKSVKEEGWDGKDDAELLQIAHAKDRVILTLDKDFGNLLRFPLQTHCGVVLLQMRLQHPSIVNNRLQQVLPSLAAQDLRNTLVIVRELTVRIRR
jgi:predicted nuclease of predicted toxin-antitoxin system